MSGCRQQTTATPGYHVQTMSLSVQVRIRQMLGLARCPGLVPVADTATLDAESLLLSGSRLVTPRVQTRSRTEPEQTRRLFLVFINNNKTYY